MMIMIMKRIVPITTNNCIQRQWAGMMYYSSTTTVQAKEIDWSRPVWSLSPEVAAKFNHLKAWVADSEAKYQKYQKPPTPIDFNVTKKKVRDQELINTLEAFYQTNVPPMEKYEMSEQEKITTQENITYLKELDSIHEQFIPILEKEMEFYRTVRTTANTTIHDMKLNYPLIHEEIENELENREWFKDTQYEKAHSASDHHH